MSKKKLFYIFSVFLLLGMTTSVLNARAHAPINIDMEYDVDAQHLSVIYTHGVSDPTEHYIESIEVWVNITQIWEYHGHFYFNDSVPGKGENYAIAVRPSVAPNYTFYYTEQPTDITPITTSHTLAHYILPLPGLQKTGEPLDTPIDENTGKPVGFIKEGRTNITLSATCSDVGVLTEHYYVGLPYYNPHLTFAEAAMPATVSTIIVFALLFILPKLGQKNAPKIKEEKSRN
ncbi:MAG: hypothetical protein HWN79_13670 [Candidatus Lokiarchaeota archaeon]|nr:hypothetical protein [Candidatus Lokiarchaeota archaeon]